MKAGGTRSGTMMVYNNIHVYPSDTKGRMAKQANKRTDPLFL